MRWTRTDAQTGERPLRTRLERHHADAWGWALHCCAGERHAAEEVLQDAYLRILEGRARFGGGSGFRTWLFGVIRNVAREHRRRALREASRLVGDVPPDAPAGGASPHDAAERRVLAARLRNALDRLPERQRDVLHLVFYQGLTVAEAAEVLGVGVGTARTHYARAKDAMRKELEPQWSE